jgi:hypothetical protein
MGYKSKARRIVKDTREPILGNGSSLVPGKEHKVTIKSISVNMVADNTNQIDLVFTDSFDETHRDNMFVFSKNSGDLSYHMKQLVVATAKNGDEVRTIYDGLMTMDLSVIDVLVGRSLLLSTKYNGDYINVETFKPIRSTNNGGNFFQSSETNNTPETETTNNKPRVFLELPSEAKSFFGTGG